jgi:hypothetical protein
VLHALAVHHLLAMHHAFPLHHCLAVLHELHHRLRFHVFGEFIQLGNLFRLKKRFGIRQSLFFDSLQAGHLIVCQIELFLPREKARGALRLELHGTHLPALLNHAGLALLGGTGRSRGSFLALLSPKRDTACDHQRHPQAKNCLSHIHLKFDLKLTGESRASFPDLANCCAVFAGPDWRTQRAWASRFSRARA